MFLINLFKFILFLGFVLFLVLTAVLGVTFLNTPDQPLYLFGSAMAGVNAWFLLQLLKVE